MARLVPPPRRTAARVHIGEAVFAFGRGAGRMQSYVKGRARSRAVIATRLRIIGADLPLQRNGVEGAIAQLAGHPTGKDREAFVAQR